MPLDRRRLLQSVARLVEKPDVRALDLSLMATVREIVAARSIDLFSLHDDHDVAGRKVLVPVRADSSQENGKPAEGIPLESAAEYAHCYRAQEKAIVPQGAGVKIIHPIKIKTGVIGFLALECEKDDPHDQEIVSILLAFYRNYASLLHDAQRDELTGLLNRKIFDERVMQLIATLNKTPATGDGSGEYCLALVDVDLFKTVNDRFGHLVGDETLVLFARDMVDAFRGGDLLFRIGGEEFVVVLRDVDLPRAIAVLERFRHATEARDYPQIGTMTISVGVSQITSGDFPTNVLDRADRALYCAKSDGRNRVYSYEHLVEQKRLEPVQWGNDPELF